MRGLATALLVLCAAGALIVAVKAVRTVGAALQAQRDVQRTVSGATPLRESLLTATAVREVALTLPPTVRSLEALADEIAPFEPVLGTARGLPARVSWVAEAPEALRAGIALGRAATLGAEPVAAFLEGRPHPNPLPEGEGVPRSPLPLGEAGQAPRQRGEDG